MASYLDDLLASALDQMPEKAEAELASRAAAGDRLARDYLARTCYRAVVSVAVSVARETGRDPEDLAGAACVGLLTAIESYRLGHGTRLSSWAWQRMLDAATQEAAASGRMLTTSRWTEGRRGAAWATHAAMAQELGREPTNQELAIRLGWPRITVDRLLAAGSVCSLDAELWAAGGGPVTPRALVAPDDTAGEALQLDLIQQLRARLSTLTRRQRTVLAAVYGLGGRPPLTTTEAAAELGVTRQAVEQVLQAALVRLRRDLED